jgi:hypothetical protein
MTVLFFLLCASACAASASSDNWYSGPCTASGSDFSLVVRRERREERREREKSKHRKRRAISVLL